MEEFANSSIENRRSYLHSDMDDCQFNIKLKDGPVEWITQFFDMEIDQNIQSSGQGYNAEYFGTG